MKHVNVITREQNSSPWPLGAVLLVDWPLEEVLQLRPIDHPTARHQFQIVALLQDQSIRASNIAIQAGSLQEPAWSRSNVWQGICCIHKSYILWYSWWFKIANFADSGYTSDRIPFIVWNMPQWQSASLVRILEKTLNGNNIDMNRTD